MHEWEEGWSAYIQRPGMLHSEIQQSPHSTMKTVKVNGLPREYQYQYKQPMKWLSRGNNSALIHMLTARISFFNMISINPQTISHVTDNNYSTKMKDPFLHISDLPVTAIWPTPLWGPLRIQMTALGTGSHWEKTFPQDPEQCQANHPAGSWYPLQPRKKWLFLVTQASLLFFLPSFHSVFFEERTKKQNCDLKDTMDNFHH